MTEAGIRKLAKAAGWQIFIWNSKRIQLRQISTGSMVTLPSLEDCREFLEKQAPQIES